jgi:predicted nuclease of restriction endonuclease-like RecB superfamily
MKIDELEKYAETIDELLDVLIEVKGWMINQGILKSKTMNRVNEILDRYGVNTNG